VCKRTFIVISPYPVQVWNEASTRWAVVDHFVYCSNIMIPTICILVVHCISNNLIKSSVVICRVIINNYSIQLVQKFEQLRAID